MFRGKIGRLPAIVALILLSVSLPGSVEAVTRKWSRPICSGVMLYHLQTYVSGRGPQHIYYLKVDLENPSLVVKPALAHGTIGKLETTGKLARRHGAVGAINATFFDTSGRHRNWPVGLIMINGRLLNKTILYRTAIGITPGNDVFFGVPRIKGQLVGEEGYPGTPIWGINRTRKRHEIVLFTPEYGTTTGTPSLGREIIIRQGKVAAFADGNSIIPSDGCVISIDGGSSAINRMPQMGEDVQLNFSLGSGWESVTQALTGGPRLLMDGHIRVTSRQEGFRGGILLPTARSALGLTRDNKLILAVVDGRRPGYSTGVTFTELARLMQGMGAVEAMGLDSGGSSTLYAGGKVVNRPSDGAQRPVSNALLILKR